MSLHVFWCPSVRHSRSVPRRRVRAAAPATVAALTALTGTAPALLTGDNAHTAARVAVATGISDVRADLPVYPATPCTYSRRTGRRPKYVQYEGLRPGTPGARTYGDISRYRGGRRARPPGGRRGRDDRSQDTQG